MFRIKIICVGKLKEKYLQLGISEYSKRLKPYLNLELIEVADEACPERAGEAEKEKIKNREAERILKSIEYQEHVILLDIHGKNLDSPEVAALLEDLAVQGRSNVTLVIGGSLGVGNAVAERADYRWSFSKLTFPHQLMRLMLLEQLYRAVKISKGEPYHK